MAERAIELVAADELGVDDVLEVLREIFDLDGREITPGEFRIHCPDPKHEDLTPSCDVNLETGFWNCFSCGAGSDLLGLGARVLHKSRHAVEKLLRPSDPDAIVASIRNRMRKRRREIKGKVKESTWEPVIPSLDSYGKIGGVQLEELRARGFKRKHLDSWGVRSVDQAELTKDPSTLKEDSNPTFTISNVIGIPIVDHEGVVRAWCYRATSDSEEWVQRNRYVYTPGVTETISRIWFGLHRFRNERRIVTVEGALDAIWCSQNGHPAVAMLGTNATKKIEALTRFDHVTMLGDRGVPGFIAVSREGWSLAELGVPATVALYRKWMRDRGGKRASDPQELHPLDLDLAIHCGEPWATFARRPGVRAHSPYGDDQRKSPVATSRRRVRS